MVKGRIHSAVMWRWLLLFFTAFFAVQCSSDGPSSLPVVVVPTPTPISSPLPEAASVNYLALGDSYTIGASVCASCRFPEQLKRKLESAIPNLTVNLQLVAQSGWTTSNLISALQERNPANDKGMVTLLIGVNNQFQNREFSIYEREFPELVNRAIFLAKGDKSRVIVISIPDYAYTPFGQRSLNPDKISTEIDRYNAFAKSYCDRNAIKYVSITDITRQGVAEPYLVALDGLHPSEKAYALFVDRIFPFASAIVRK